LLYSVRQIDGLAFIGADVPVSVYGTIAVGYGVGVFVLNIVGGIVGMFVIVLVGVAVSVTVGVADSVFVAVGVGVRVGVRVGVHVGEEVGVLVNMASLILAGPITSFAKLDELHARVTDDSFPGPWA